MVSNFNKISARRLGWAISIACLAILAISVIAIQLNQWELGATILTWLAILTLGIAGTITLIRSTKLKPATAKSATTTEQLFEILEKLPIGVCTRTNGKVSYANETWRTLAGEFGKNDFIFDPTGKSDTKRVHPEDVKAVKNFFGSQAGATETAAINFRLQDGFSVSYVEACLRNLSAGDSSKTQVAYLVDVSKSFEYEQELKEKNQSVESGNEMLRKLVLDLEKNFQAMVQSLVKAVEAKDPYTAGHSERVMAYAVWIGEAMNLSSEDLRTLRMGCLVHDVGKIGIRDSILTKPEGLTPDEFTQVRTHPELGARMVESIPLFEDCLPIIRDHHEKLNGTGYPNGLKGDEISLLVRIATVADCFDAMTSTRAYREGMPADQAFAELQKDVLKGALDPDVVQIFSEIIHREGLMWIPTSQAA